MDVIDLINIKRYFLVLSSKIIHNLYVLLYSYIYIYKIYKCIFKMFVDLKKYIWSDNIFISLCGVIYTHLSTFK